MGYAVLTNAKLLYSLIWCKCLWLNCVKCVKKVTCRTFFNNFDYLLNTFLSHYNVETLALVVSVSFFVVYDGE